MERLREQGQRWKWLESLWLWLVLQRRERRIWLICPGRQEERGGGSRKKIWEPCWFTSLRFCGIILFEFHSDSTRVGSVVVDTFVKFWPPHPDCQTSNTSFFFLAGARMFTFTGLFKVLLSLYRRRFVCLLEEWTEPPLGQGVPELRIIFIFMSDSRIELCATFIAFPGAPVWTQSCGAQMGVRGL